MYRFAITTMIQQIRKYTEHILKQNQCKHIKNKDLKKKKAIWNILSSPDGFSCFIIMEEIDNKAEKRKDADIMKKYKAVFSDIDGTLLNSKHQIPENTRKKIKQINQNGIPYVLVSARMPKGMTAIRAELEAKSPMICYSGALVVDEEDHPIYSVAMPQEVAMKLCRRVYELNPKISVNIYTNDEWLVKDKKEYWAAQESDITGVIPQEVSFEDEEVYKEVHKVLCMGDKEDIAALEQQLVKEFPQIRIYRSKDTYLEIMSMKASKSDAIHMLKDHFHVKQEEIMAFGDNFNDIDMIRYAGLGVAMGNAAYEVKEAADIVTDINDNEGERQILDKYFR